jgi:hypothetical protein
MVMIKKIKGWVARCGNGVKELGICNWELDLTTLPLFFLSALQTHSAVIVNS